MYPIIVKEEKQVIREDLKYPLKDTWVTLEMLRKHINEGEYFTIMEDDNECYILVNRDRLETDEEQEKRVEREKNYMINYHKFHNNKCG